MDKPWLWLKFDKGSISYEEGLPYVGSSNIPPTIIKAPELREWFFGNTDYLLRVNYCWLVDRYLITLVEDNNTVTIKVFTKDGDNWVSSNVNNANFLGDLWDSMWTNQKLAYYWHKIQSEEEGSCDWDLTDTPITVDKLFKALYEYTDWVVELDKDREAGEWEIVT